MVKEKLSAEEERVKDRAILKENGWIIVPADIHTAWQEGEDFANYGGLGTNEFAYHPKLSIIEESGGGTYQEHKHAIDGLSEELARMGVSSSPSMATVQECQRAYVKEREMGRRLFYEYYVRTDTMTEGGKNVLAGSPSFGDGICFQEGSPERGYEGLPGGQLNVRAFAVVRLK